MLRFLQSANIPCLPKLTPKKVIDILLRNGFEHHHTTGSHRFYFHPIRKKITMVAYHTKDLPRGTLTEIIKQSGLRRSDFL
ncbi:MAG: type II toxin-antitoxin system HicA family toxin [bacterium]|nr:type II toxin-antitoxin system HicA family toxin [bacterium]